MAVDLMKYSKMEDQLAIQEAASAGIKSMEHLIRALSQPAVDCREITDFTVSKFKKVISMLDRTGHARFRRGPVVVAQPSPAPARPSPQQQSLSLTLDFSKPDLNCAAMEEEEEGSFSISPPVSTSANSTSFMSSITGDGSVSNGKALSSPLLGPVPAAVSAGKPPLSASMKKKCHEHTHSGDISGKLSARCHCSKKRYIKIPSFGTSPPAKPPQNSNID